MYPIITNEAIILHDKQIIKLPLFDWEPIYLDGIKVQHAKQLNTSQQNILFDAVHDTVAKFCRVNEFLPYDCTNFDIRKIGLIREMVRNARIQAATYVDGAYQNESGPYYYVYGRKLIFPDYSDINLDELFHSEIKISNAEIYEKLEYLKEYKLLINEFNYLCNYATYEIADYTIAYQTMKRDIYAKYTAFTNSFQSFNRDLYNRLILKTPEFDDYGYEYYNEEDHIDPLNAHEIKGSPTMNDPFGLIWF